MKTALITGVTGQDGAYLSEFLLAKGYTVHGIKRRASLFNTERIDHLYQDPHESDRRLVLHHGDMTDSLALTRTIQQVQPDEIYNLAAQSHVAVSFEEPEYTANADGLGALRVLEAIRILGLERKTRFYQASTSELYGLVRGTMSSPPASSTACAISSTMPRASSASRSSGAARVCARALWCLPRASTRPDSSPDRSWSGSIPATSVPRKSRPSAAMRRGR